jgi:hypothetical protein
VRPARLLAVAISALCVAVLAACGGSSSSDVGPRHLTQEQAELLATVRFRNYDAGVRSIVVTIPDTAAEGPGSGGRVEGWVDFARHLGYAAATQGSTPLGAVAWSAERIAINESARGPVDVAVPREGWRSDRLDPQASSMTRALAIVLNLASDRPENPLLLRQSDAAFLRTAEIDGTKVVVLAGPSPATAASTPSTEAPASPRTRDRIRYWIDGDGLLRRVQVTVPGTTAWTTIDLSDAEGVTLDAEQLGRALG